MSKKTISGIVAGLVTVAGLIGVIQPFVPDEAKAVLVAAVAVVNFLAFSPIVKFFEAEDV